MRRLAVLVCMLSQLGCGLVIEGPRRPDAATSELDARIGVDADGDARQMDDAPEDDAPAPSDDVLVDATDAFVDLDAGTCPVDVCGEITTRTGIVDIDVSEDGTRAVMLGSARVWLDSSISDASATPLSHDFATSWAGCTRIAVSDTQNSFVVLCDTDAHRVFVGGGMTSDEDLGRGYVAVASGGLGSADAYALLHAAGNVTVHGGASDIRYAQSALPYCTSAPAWAPRGVFQNLAMHPVASEGVFACAPLAVETIAVGGPEAIRQTFYGDAAGRGDTDCMGGSCCTPNPTEEFVDLSVLPHVVATISRNAIRFPRNGAVPPLFGSAGEPLTSVSLGLLGVTAGVAPTSFMVAWSTDYAAYAQVWPSCSSTGALRFHTPEHPLTKVRISRCMHLGSETAPHFTAITLEDGGRATLRRVTCVLP